MDYFEYNVDIYDEVVRQMIQELEYNEVLIVY